VLLVNVVNQWVIVVNELVLVVSLWCLSGVALKAEQKRRSRERRAGVVP
jgi:hypothetical protein